MAKRNKPDEDTGEEGYEFIPPDFDEDAFIHKEMVSFRTTIILFAWGVVAALISWAIFAAMDGAQTGWFAGLLVCGATGYLLRFIYPALKIDISHFGRREWMGTGFLFFFTWLAFFILVVNPPISDYADPQAVVITSPDVQQAGAVTEMHLFTLDNSGVESYDFILQRGSNTVATKDALVPEGPHRLLFRDELAAGSYTYTFTVTDEAGRTGVSTGQVDVSSRALRYTGPRDDVMQSPTDRLSVETPASVGLHRVYLDPIDGGPDVNLTYDEDIDAWAVGPKACGLPKGEHSFAIVAEATHAFVGPHFVPGGVIRHNGPFNLTVDYELGPGDRCTQRLVEPQSTTAPEVGVPGPGLAVLLAGLLMAVAVIRRRS